MDGPPGVRYRATVEYDGTAYSGFQVQRDRRTIQGELEGALQRLAQADVRVAGAGRTDAGVHARGQTVSFDLDWAHGCDALRRAMNASLPLDIAVSDVDRTRERFHARYSARRRLYVYRLHNAEVRSPLVARHAYHVRGTLDRPSMTQAAACLVGEHDFAAFGQPPSGVSTTRVVFRAELSVECAEDRVGVAPRTGTMLRFEIEANAFLRGMVRRIVGSLLRVGTGAWDVSGFHHVLATKDISLAGPQAPACGLFMWRVSYASQSVD